MESLKRGWRSLGPVTRLLLGFTLTVVVGGLAGLAALSLALPHAHFAERLAGRVLKYQPGVDSWHHMQLALQYLLSAPGQPFYEHLFFRDHVKFIYPPASLLPMYALHRLGVALADLPVTMNSFLFLAPLLTACFVAAILNRSTEGAGLASPSRADRAIRSVLAFGLTLAFYPVWKSYQLGQAQAWINCFVTVAIWCWLCGRRDAAGLLVGLACLIKPQYLLILLWGTSRRQWRFALLGAAVVAAGVLLYGALFGYADQLEYFRVLSYISRHGEAYHYNQSVNGLLNRLYFGSAPFLMDGYPPYHPVVFGGTVVSSAVLILAAFLWPMARAGRGSVLDLCVIVVSATLASPVAWEHHYGCLPAIFACLIAGLSGQRVFGRATMPYLTISYALCAGWFGGMVRLNHSALNVLQSYLFFGALMVLVALYRLLSPGRGVPRAA